MSDEPWLPPRRGRDSDQRFGEPTPATASEHSREPALRDLPPDDAAVIALTSSTPPSLAEPLPDSPYDDSEETPPPVPNPNDPQVLARKEQMRVIANAGLARAAAKQPDDQPSLTERVFALELANSKLRLDVDNLTALVKELLRRHAGV